MKNKIMMLLAAAFICMNAHAQKIAADKVPANVIGAFTSKFPDAEKVHWEMESKSEYEAEFHLHQKESSATFSSDGKWIETETEIKAADLPSLIQNSLHKNFEGYKIEEASKNETAAYGSCYEVTVEKRERSFEVLFNDKGEILNKEQEKKDHKD